jgi:prepilin-type N-terminal cleavage/methylation domain-containing protein
MKEHFVQSTRNAGFSLVELIVSMVITLVILGAAVTTFTGALKTRDFQTGRTDALTSAQAGINIMSREIGNAGFGLNRGLLASNGLVQGDCTDTRLHFRANTNNTNNVTTDPGEDVTFYWDGSSIVRYDPNANPSKSSIINQVSKVQFVYHDYASNGTSTDAFVPSDRTGRVTIRLTVLLSNDGNVSNKRNVFVESDITLRNSPYSIGQY